MWKNAVKSQDGHEHPDCSADQSAQFHGYCGCKTRKTAYSSAAKTISGEKAVNLANTTVAINAYPKLPVTLESDAWKIVLSPQKIIFCIECRNISGVNIADFLKFRKSKPHEVREAWLHAMGRILRVDTAVSGTMCCGLQPVI